MDAIKRKHRHLVLFDIDGTLTRGQSADPVALEQMFWMVHHLRVHVDWAKIQGMTTLQVLDFYLNGKVAKKKIQQCLREYIKVFRCSFTDAPFRIQPGAKRFLTILKDRGCVFANVTGNMKPMAELKMKRVGLSQFFKTGGYGDDAPRRDQLIKIAIRRAVKKYRLHLDGDKLTLFGDTPRDVQAAKRAGVQCVAVATGVHSIAQLRREKPNLLVRSLKRPKMILDFLGV